MAAASRHPSERRSALFRFFILCFGDPLILQSGPWRRLAHALNLPAVRFRPHPYTLYELNPDWRSVSGRSRHCSRGFRGADVAMPKPEGRFRIVCMGESSTYCVGIENDEQTYPARLEVHLKALMPGTELDVINAGVPGYTSIENLLRLQFHVLPLKPDLIVYYYTHNDVHARTMAGLSRDYREYSRSWFEPHDDYGIVGRINRRRALAKGVIANLVRGGGKRGRSPSNIPHNPPDAFRANLTAFATIAQAFGVSVLFVNPNYSLRGGDQAEGRDGLYGRAVQEHRKVVEEVSHAVGAGLCDIVGKVPYPDDPNAFPSDCYIDSAHFNESGADRAAEAVAEAIAARAASPSQSKKRIPA
jgi:lysophospholipase L1-like esterase